ncbi:PREDICTED: ABC transporter G family member 20-like, partial [Rhagoletis zephyria]|uniref:ABC transporter G family member 20-like n=1 Tax=Rhagoletis zephyria TaxID=28612 RepID=UPI000811295B
MSAISLSNVAFSYSGTPVLNNINAVIPYGRIYSLLGPSGAGKTTLLRLVLGRIRPTAGRITVLGDEPGKNNRIIGKKMLKEVLGLPDDKSEIWELSGGQQKMVSLSLTFLHSPRLLILDEPTVGSDPVLGNCIWNYLHQCCLENISIIIVTHYIEEATFGHVVGIMRNGTILTEGSPNQLTAKYGQQTLEDVFLHLCKVNTAVFNEEAEPLHSKGVLSAIEKVDVYYLNPIYYDSLEAAIGAITDGKAIGAVWFGRNFSDAFESRLSEPESIDNETLVESTVKMFIDTGNYLFANGFVDSMRQTMYGYMKKFSLSQNLPMFDAPIDVRE